MTDDELADIRARAADWSLDSGWIRNDVEALADEVEHLRAVNEELRERNRTGNGRQDVFTWQRVSRASDDQAPQ